MTLGRHLARLLAALSAAAALVHFVFTSAHFAEWWGYGTFFLLVAAAQLAWAAAVLSRPPSRRLLAVGAAGNLAVAAVWVVSRTGGIPFGPAAGTTEAIGVADVLCTAFEVALAGLAAILLLRPSIERRPARPIAGRLTAATAAGALAVAGLTFTPALAGAADHEHSHDSAIDATSAAGAHAHGAAASTAPPTAAQQKAADALIAATRAAVARFDDLDVALAAGYRPITPPGARVVHYGNPAYMLDSDVLDPQHVESLVYARTARGPVLLGAMYMMPLGVAGPEIGGSLTHWHVHDDLCIDPSQLAQVARLPGGACPPGSSVQPTPEMMHVWSVDYPGGPFADITAEGVAQVLAGLR